MKKFITIVLISILFIPLYSRENSINWKYNKNNDLPDSVQTFIWNGETITAVQSGWAEFNKNEKLTKSYSSFYGKRENTYDASGRLVKEIKKSAMSFNWTDYDLEYQYFYDQNENLIKEIKTYYKSSTNEKGDQYIHNYIRTDNGLCIIKEGDFLWENIYYSYNSNGYVKTETTESGSVISYYYDDNNRLTKKLQVSASQEDYLIFDKKYEYNDSDRLVYTSEQRSNYKKNYPSIYIIHLYEEYYTYYSNGVLEKFIEYKDDEILREKYYDIYGNIIYFKDISNEYWYYNIYDKHNKLIKCIEYKKSKY